MTDATPDATPDESLIRAVRARRSLRAFDPAPLPDAVLRRLFEAARWAPSGGNGQPWRFILARSGSEGFERLAATLRSGNAWAERAPVLVLAAVKERHDRPDKPPRPNRRALLDLGLAVENLLLQAASEGVSSHPMAGFDADEAAEVVGVPEHHRAVLMLALGLPGDPDALDPKARAKDERPRTRLPLAEIVFENVFGGATTLAADGVRGGASGAES